MIRVQSLTQGLWEEKTKPSIRKVLRLSPSHGPVFLDESNSLFFWATVFQRRMECGKWLSIVPKATVPDI